ncbi:hypothetical protein OESDEN_24130 [Oesophagostomum dentatum]|uniref:Uncharacterized protein n=1 Tax=Oesophagostomum dentatum TaxID=61180 RepID=A0A0B1RZ75_OESDE|nr:hypothetical protein OESDEN_24130 [Oesophagostomum dentatum]
MFPSQNGFYVRPQPIDVSIFALEELPPVKAKARKISLNGTLPIEPVVGKVKKADDPLRVRREASASEDSHSAGRSSKPIELIVKYGGLVVRSVQLKK